MQTQMSNHFYAQFSCFGWPALSATQSSIRIEDRNAQLERFFVRTKVAALDLTQSYAYREIAGRPENSGFPTPTLLTQHGNNFHVPS
jgi:hypothetical protein